MCKHCHAAVRLIWQTVVQDKIPRGSYHMTVPFSWRSGRVRVFITPGPTFVYEKPDGEVVVDSTGAVKKVRRQTSLKSPQMHSYGFVRW